MTRHLAAAAAPIADMEQARFDRALGDLHFADPRARVSLSEDTALAVGFDGDVKLAMPAAAQALPESDRAAAAAVLFLDQFGSLFGIAGWHVLDPRYASPLGTTVWFTFAAETHVGDLLVNVCAEGDTVKHVRIERSAA
ncbi:MAG: hypothetical protein H7287_12165 [Thermoleophilia bacterium]|nr:hypothetical protein [Thermoleophilia bacterium]